MAKKPKKESDTPEDEEAGIANYADAERARQSGVRSPDRKRGQYADGTPFEYTVPRLECDECTRVFMRPDELARHKESVHPKS